MTTRICWICGELSDTSEHRIKCSDFVQRFGKSPYKKDNELVHVKEDRIRPIQGPGSQLIKYEKNLCAECNNASTHSFDEAYKEFISWVTQNGQQILERRVIDFEVVYGADWQDKQLKLFKYFAKCFGCRISEAGKEVPRDVIDIINKDTFKTELYVTFMVNEDMLLLPSDCQPIGTEGLWLWKDKLTGDEIGFHSGHNYCWLTFMYWYNHFPIEPVGASWIANAKHIYLGWYKPLTAEQRSDVIAKINAK